MFEKFKDNLMLWIVMSVAFWPEITVVLGAMLVGLIYTLGN